ncbi:MAG: DNA mismatch repair protein MutS [Deltaproteobacteria bacterium]|nr:DNA mismatch repair protein MutS [Deltaproteobacteria bacterium]
MTEPRSATAPPANDPALQTPMMQQYLEAKAECPEALLLMRMGDFYELFLDDAVEGARILELTLTSRNKKDESPIPMAGIPYHALQAYLPRLLAAGRKVAICEQVEDPKVAKGLVKRALVRIITPGVVLDEVALDGREPNWLVGLVEADGAVALACLEVSTGERRAERFADRAAALSALARLDPREVVVPPAPPDGDDARANAARQALPGRTISRHPAPAGSDPAARADAMLLAYARAMHRAGDLALQPLVVDDGARLELPPATVVNLELLRSIRDASRKGSLIGLVDRARTPMGSRLLRDWLLAPLVDPVAIRRRHDVVQAAVEDVVVKDRVRDELRGVADLERLVGRIVARSASPRDLTALASSLERIPPILEALARSDAPALAGLATGLDPLVDTARRIRRALVDDPGPLKDGGVFRAGWDAELDELMTIASEGKDWFLAYEQRLKDESGIASVKVRYNSVFGYYIEVTRANLDRVPATWLRKQTLANAERYFTIDLKEREDKVLGADERRLALEARLFEALRDELAREAARLQATARALASVDVLIALADVAASHGWVRPTLVDEPTLVIEGGRHPVVESVLPAGQFVPNDVTLTPEARLVILTGPNMAGKSTVMRQVALACILAQMGSFVPASRATIGVVDKVFTRVGAADDLARGQSTFMVEMTETADILAHATARSLVILDEIGRGTSTWDGLSIAWAVAEHLHDHSRARTMFATHYHELTALATTREAVANWSIAVREWEDDVVFLRRLVPGGANKSYGIQVARLAGLPAPVLARAREVLGNLEAMAVDPDSRPRLARGDHAPAPQRWQLSLFAPPPPPVTPEAASPRPAAPARDPLRELVTKADPNAMTPRAALDLLYKLKHILKKEGVT